MISKILYGSILLLLTQSAFSQFLAHVDCEQVGDPDWSIYDQHLKDRGISQLATIRENDQNIKAVSSLETSYRYVLNKLFIRWSLDDSSIPYVIRIADIMDEEITRFRAKECAFVIYPDSIMLKQRKEHLLVTIERENRDGLNKGLEGFLYPVDSEDRVGILKQLEDCPGLLCKLDILLKRKLYLDALSLVEAQFEIEPEKKDELKTLYWKIVNWNYMED